jgi:hypothetical protein
MEMAVRPRRGWGADFACDELGVVVGLCGVGAVCGTGSGFAIGGLSDGGDGSGVGVC